MKRGPDASAWNPFDHQPTLLLVIVLMWSSLRKRYDEDNLKGNVGSTACMYTTLQLFPDQNLYEICPLDSQATNPTPLEDIMSLASKLGNPKFLLNHLSVRECQLYIIEARTI